MKKVLISIMAIASLSGCSSMSGLGGSSSFGCKAPKGVSCTSVSGTYANAMQHNLPGDNNSNDKEIVGKAPILQPIAVTKMVGSGEPVRSRARVLRIWIAPWEDTDGDLRDQSYAFVVVENGRWMIEHNRANIMKSFAARKPTEINATNNQASSQDQADKKEQSNAK